MDETNGDKSTGGVHVVIGAGPVGWTTAERLAERGHRVRVVTRSGSGPEHPLVERCKADAADAGAILGLTTDAASIINAANPPYHRWATEWPPIHQSMMSAAAANDAVYVLMDNLYAYGPTGGRTMRESDPLLATGTKGRTRAEMATTLLDAHASGRHRATIARASDFVGPRVLGAALGERVVPRVIAGKSVQVLGHVDVAHSFTYMPDVAETLVVLATDERAWGRAWHVPSAPAVSQRLYVAALADAAGTQVSVSSVPWLAVRAMGLFVPFMRELKETRYQFTDSFVMDSSAAEAVLGLSPTPLDRQAADTIAWWRSRDAEEVALPG